MIVRPVRRRALGERERARHAEVHQQAAAVERQPQVLAAPRRPRRRSGRPAARGATPSGQRSGLPRRTSVTRAPSDALGKAQAGDFDFGSSGMDSAGGGELSRGRRIGRLGGAVGGPVRTPRGRLATTRIVFRPRESSMPAQRVHPGGLRLPALLLALAAAGLASARAGPGAAGPAGAARTGRSPRRRRSRTRNLDAPLFYQVLIAEMQLRNGEDGHRLTSCCSTPPAAPGTSSCSAAPPTSPCRRGPATRRWRPCVAWREAAARLASRPCAIRCRCWSRSTASPKPRSRCAPLAAPGDRDRRCRACSPRCRASSAAAATAPATALLIERAAPALCRRARHARPRRWWRSGRGWLAVPRPRQGAELAQKRARRRIRRPTTPPCSRSTCCPPRPTPRRSSRRHLAASPAPPAGRPPALRAHARRRRSG